MRSWNYFAPDKIREHHCLESDSNVGLLHWQQQFLDLLSMPFLLLPFELSTRSILALTVCGFTASDWQIISQHQFVLGAQRSALDLNCLNNPLGAGSVIPNVISTREGLCSFV